jgi:hypothetical protein
VVVGFLRCADHHPALLLLLLLVLEAMLLQPS